MQYSIRNLLIVTCLFAFALVAFQWTEEIWVYSYDGFKQWFSDTKGAFLVLFFTLFLGFTAGWLSRTRVPGNDMQIVSLAVYVSLNVVMYALIHTSLKWIRFAEVEQEQSISGPMATLVKAYDTGILSTFFCSLLIAIIAAAFIHNGKFRDAFGFFSIACWLVIIVMGFINAAYSLCIP